MTNGRNDPLDRSTGELQQEYERTLASRPQSNFKCNCAPGWHPRPGTTYGECQRDVTHVYGDENPMVRWMREKHPEALGEPAYSAVGEPTHKRDLFDLTDDELADLEWEP